MLLGTVQNFRVLPKISSENFDMTRVRQREKNEFVERLRAIFAGLTIASVAKRLGIDQPAMTRYLRGEVTPGIQFLFEGFSCRYRYKLVADG